MPYSQKCNTKLDKYGINSWYLPYFNLQLCPSRYLSAFQRLNCWGVNVQYRKWSYYFLCTQSPTSNHYIIQAGWRSSVSKLVYLWICNPVFGLNNTTIQTLNTKVTNINYIGENVNRLSWNLGLLASAGLAQPRYNTDHPRRNLSYCYWGPTLVVCLVLGHTTERAARATINHDIVHCILYMGIIQSASCFQQIWPIREWYFRHVIRTSLLTWKWKLGTRECYCLDGG